MHFLSRLQKHVIVWTTILLFLGFPLSIMKGCKINKRSWKVDKNDLYYIWLSDLKEKIWHMDVRKRYLKIIDKYNLLKYFLHLNKFLKKSLSKGENNMTQTIKFLSVICLYFCNFCCKGRKCRFVISLILSIFLLYFTLLYA